MNFTGKSLTRVREALNLAVAELKNQNGLCPDVVQYAEDIKAREDEIEQLEKLAARIDGKQK